MLAADNHPIIDRPEMPLTLSSEESGYYPHFLHQFPSVAPVLWVAYIDRRSINNRRIEAIQISINTAERPHNAGGILAGLSSAPIQRVVLEAFMKNDRP